MDGEIPPKEVKALLDDETDVCIVDVRDEASFERSHIPGSENLPFHELSRRIEELEGEDHIVTVCPHGKASVQAAQLIGSYEGTAEARVESMSGGLEEYGLQFGLVREESEEESTTNAESPF